jgi:uncharacterized protein YndB with AHSA1/START domain
VPDLLHQLEIATGPEAIYALVSSADGMAKWWAADARDEPDPVAAVALSFFGGQTTYRLRPQTFVAPTQATWRCETGKEWAGTYLTFLLRARDTGTLLQFSHSGWEEATSYFISCNTVWGELLFRLKAEAEGHPRGPLFGRDGLNY